MGEIADRIDGISSSTAHKKVSEFLATRLNVLRYVSNAMENIQDEQKQQVDAKAELVLKL